MTRENTEGIFERLSDLPLEVQVPLALAGIAAAAAGTFVLPVPFAVGATLVGLGEAELEVTQLFFKLRKCMNLKSSEAHPRSLTPKARAALNAYHHHTNQANEALKRVMAEYE